MIVVKTSDNKIFEIEEIAAKQSETINRMIVDGCADSTIPLPNISSEIFVKIIEYSKRHATAPVSEEEMVELREFDAEFVKVGQEILYSLIMAANYLEIKSLIDPGCLEVVDMVKSKTPEEIRKMFDIENDLTPEEEEEIRSQNAWAFE